MSLEPSTAPGAVPLDSALPADVAAPLPAEDGVAQLFATLSAEDAPPLDDDADAAPLDDDAVAEYVDADTDRRDDIIVGAGAARVPALAFLPTATGAALLSAAADAATGPPAAAAAASAAIAAAAVAAAIASPSTARSPALARPAAACGASTTSPLRLYAGRLTLKRASTMLSASLAVMAAKAAAVAGLPPASLALLVADDDNEGGGEGSAPMLLVASASRIELRPCEGAQLVARRGAALVLLPGELACVLEEMGSAKQGAGSGAGAEA